MKGFGGFPGGGNVQALMKQAQKMQEQLQKAQEEADKITAESQSGGGAVKVVANGKSQVVSLTIAKEAVDPNDVEVLQDMILVAVNGALTEALDKVKQELSKATGGMSIPGLF